MRRQSRHHLWRHKQALFNAAKCHWVQATVCSPATGWNSIQWQQVAPANGQSTSERATAAAGTSSCTLFKSRLHSHQLPMILLTIGTLAQACTVSSFMLMRWRLNLVEPEINPRQTRVLSHRQQNASTTHIKIRFLLDRKHNDTSITTT